MLLERVAELPGGPLERPLERCVAERLDLLAVVADQVVVMVIVGARRLEPGDPVACVHALNEAELGERVERPIDACDADGAAVSTQPAGALVAGIALDDADSGDDCPIKLV